MAKPATVPSGWAASGPITVPTGGKIAAGFAPGERGAAQYVNWFQHWTGEWLSWLNAGTLDGNYHITGNLTVDGSFTHADTITLHCEPADSFESNNFTAAAAVHSPNRDGWTFAASTTPIHYAIKGLRDGDQILSYGMALHKITGAGVTIASKLVTTTNSGDSLSTGDSQAGGAGLYAFGSGDSFAAIAVADTGAAYYIRIIPSAGGSGDSIDAVVAHVKRTIG